MNKLTESKEISIPLFTSIIMLSIASSVAFGLGIVLLIWNYTGWLGTSNGAQALWIISRVNMVFPYTVGLAILSMILSVGLAIIGEEETRGQNK